MHDLLRLRDFRLLFAGLTLSTFGDRALLLANGIWVKSLTGSNAQAGLVILLIAAPSLMAPLFGFVIDRVRRRPFLIGLNLVTAVAILPLLLVQGRGDVWLIYVVSAVYGMALIMNDAAVNGLIKTMLDETQLASANGLIQTAREAMRLVVPLAGAGLFAALGGRSVVLLDVATFLVGAATLTLIAVRESPPERFEQHRLREMSAGVRHLWRVSVLRRVVLTAAIALLVIGFLETAVYAVVGDGLHRRPAFLGVLMAIQGVGALVGGVSAARVVQRCGEQLACAAGFAAFAVGDLLLTSSQLPVVVLGTAILGIGLPWLLVAFYTLLQRRTPNELMGRVGTAAEVLLGTPQTLSIGLGALLISVVDYRLLLGVTAAVVLGCAAYLAIRRVDDDVEPEPAARAVVVEGAD